jgi:hypothetical protein
VELTSENKAKKSGRCKSCLKTWKQQYNAEHYNKNKQRINEGRKWVPDEDRYEDLSPVSENWFGRITKGD